MIEEEEGHSALSQWGQQLHQIIPHSSLDRYSSHLGVSSVDRKNITLILLLLLHKGGLWLKIYNLPTFICNSEPQSSYEIMPLRIIWITELDPIA